MSCTTKQLMGSVDVDIDLYACIHGELAPATRACITNSELADGVRWIAQIPPGHVAILVAAQHLPLVGVSEPGIEDLHASENVHVQLPVEITPRLCGR